MLHVRIFKSREDKFQPFHVICSLLKIFLITMARTFCINKVLLKVNLPSTLEIHSWLVLVSFGRLKAA